MLRRFEVTDLDGLADVFAKREIWEFPYGRTFSRLDPQEVGSTGLARPHGESCRRGATALCKAFEAQPGIEEGIQRLGYRKVRLMMQKTRRSVRR